ncbi:ligand-gated channel [Stenotrophomonas panacihumi]|uniref:Ligand-gated channel n=1 Tax=Stenotrophomonas panacihumi TaxID=676599 RepID=A0A0R0B3L9_9GAMM|nr:TonB-dependent receptor [Stenotrophomonas panacihumi]KRG48810.1 ligand-gated channel [Stenotrophomonas panacihumi]PTN53088.1 TonB-dependent receptor [Stenotrophomonas panacihumi]
MKPRACVLASAIVVALSPFTALAQSSPNTLDTVIVTGTRVSDRTVAESASPIDIISPEALTATGTTELATALSRAVPSLNFPRPAITDGTDAVRPVQLRGLAPDQVLVLVNGKRYHTTALVNLNGSQGRGSSPADLNTIPIAAVERIEVLRDGAAAQYGSDAIAGVINVVLKGSGTGGSIAGRYGQYSAGDGEQYQLSGDAGIRLGENGAIHFAAQAGHQDQTDRAKPYNGVVEQRYGDPEIDQGAVSYNGEYSPADYLTFYSYAMASRREVLSNGYFRWDTDNRNRPQIYPDGFLPQIYNVSKDVSWVGGFKATTEGGLNIDMSYNYGQNNLRFEVRNSLNNSMGLDSPTRFYAGTLEVTQNVLNADFSKALDVGMAYPLALAFGLEWRGEKFNESPGDPASYINGGVPSANGSFLPGAQVFAGFKPSDSGHYDRHSYSAYVDLEADVSDKFTVGLAGRYEDYSDFGDTANGKLSLRYAFTDKVALRATASTGFRAPSLQQQYFQSIATNFIDGVPYEIGTFRTDNPAAVALGAEPLKAEESTNYSVGLVLQPVDSLYVTVDAYRIDIDDRIVLSENLTSTAVRNYLQANGYAGIGGGRYFTNAVDTRTTGVDAVGTYRWALASGPLELTGGYNYNKTEIEHIAENPAALEAIDPTAVRIGRTEIGRITKGSPRDKFFLGATWSPGAWRFNATTTRWGEFTSYGTTPATDQTYDAKWTLDLAATWTLQKWSFTLGGDNVLNEYPDEQLAGKGTRTYLPYSTSSPFGFNGAFVYANIDYKW